MSKLKSTIKIAVSVIASLVVVSPLFVVARTSVFSYLADIYNGTPLELPLIFEYPGNVSTFQIVIKFNDGKKRTLSMVETKYVLKHVKHERLLKALIQGNQLHYSAHLGTDGAHLPTCLKKLGKLLCSSYDTCYHITLKDPQQKNHLLWPPNEILTLSSEEMMYKIFKESDAGRKWEQILLDTRQQLEKKIELLISETRSISQPRSLTSVLCNKPLELTLPYLAPPELISIWQENDPFILSLFEIIALENSNE